jgi:hypothetical protein
MTTSLSERGNEMTKAFVQYDDPTTNVARANNLMLFIFVLLVGCDE